MSSPETLPPDLPPLLAFDEETMTVVRAAREKLERDAADPDALLVVAMWYAMLGEYATCLLFLQRLARIRPDYPGLWRLKAGVYRRLGNESRASRCEELAREYEGPEDGGEDSD